MLCTRRTSVENKALCDSGTIKEEGREKMKNEHPLNEYEVKKIGILPNFP